MAFREVKMVLLEGMLRYTYIPSTLNLPNHLYTKCFNCVRFSFDVILDLLYVNILLDLYTEFLLKKVILGLLFFLNFFLPISFQVH